MPRGRRQRAARGSARIDTAVDEIAAVLGDYAQRRVFRAISDPTSERGSTCFRFRWFREREFTLRVQPRGKRMRIEGVLPMVAPRSALDRDLRRWLASRQNAALATHRRLDPASIRARWTNTAGDMRLRFDVLDGDWGNATRKLVHLLNELYVAFLPSSAHLDWLVESFGLDPDNPRWP